MRSMIDSARARASLREEREVNTVSSEASSACADGPEPTMEDSVRVRRSMRFTMPPLFCGEREGRWGGSEGSKRAESESLVVEDPAKGPPGGLRSLAVRLRGPVSLNCEPLLEAMAVCLRASANQRMLNYWCNSMANERLFMRECLSENWYKTQLTIGFRMIARALQRGRRR